MGQVHSEYTAIFGAVLPFGCLSSFLVGYVGDRWGLVKALAAEMLLLAAANAIGLVPILELQVVRFVLFVLGRSFIFSVMASYLAFVFGYGTLGRLMALSSLVGAALSFVPHAVMGVVLARGGGGDFTLVNAGLLGMSVVALMFPWHLHRRMAAAAAQPADEATGLLA